MIPSLRKHDSQIVSDETSERRKTCQEQQGM